ncbi:hypothetical protein CR513_48094, partial [Mucuna pruriens]
MSNVIGKRVSQGMYLFEADSHGSNKSADDNLTAVVERKHQHLFNVARVLMFQAKVPMILGGECVVAATYLINRTPSPNLNNASPFIDCCSKRLESTSVGYKQCLPQWRLLNVMGYSAAKLLLLDPNVKVGCINGDCLDDEIRDLFCHWCGDELV